MFRRPDEFQPHSIIRAFKDAKPASHAVLIDDKCLHLLGPGDTFQLNGIEVTPFYTCLATLAFLPVYHGFEPAGGQQFIDIGQSLEAVDYLTAAFAAIAGGRYLGSIRG